MRLEAVTLPVADVDRAKAFYRSAGFREDVDYAAGPDFRVVQFTPPGSGASIVFGAGITSAAPGSVESIVLAVDDLERVRSDLVAHGLEVSEVFHDLDGVFCHLSPRYRVAGPDPAGRHHASFARFADPDGNGWLLRGLHAPGRRLARCALCMPTR